MYRCSARLSDQLSFAFELFDFDDFSWALQKSQESFRYGEQTGVTMSWPDVQCSMYSNIRRARKAILNMDYPDRMKEVRTQEELDTFEGPVVL